MFLKKRPANINSPLSRLTQEFSNVMSCDTDREEKNLSQKSKIDENGEVVYCTPEYLSGDFCTPEGQVQELNWSQGTQVALDLRLCRS